jgi:hypothetical protein
MALNARLKFSKTQMPISAGGVLKDSKRIHYLGRADFGREAEILKKKSHHQVSVWMERLCIDFEPTRLLV